MNSFNRTLHDLKKEEMTFTFIVYGWKVVT